MERAADKSEEGTVERGTEPQPRTAKGIHHGGAENATVRMVFVFGVGLMALGGLQSLADAQRNNAPSGCRTLSFYAIVALFAFLDAEVAKLADAPDLGSGGVILRGSSPLLGINQV